MKRAISFGVALVLLGTLATAVQPGRAPRYALAAAGPAIGWSSVDGGGAMAVSGGSYGLGGTIGQPDAGRLAGGSYALRGGFWGGYIEPPVPPTAVPPTTVPPTTVPPTPVPSAPAPTKYTRLVPFVQR